MAFMTMVIYLVIYCIRGFIWGWAVNKIVENKGYRKNWFWWGFFFGIIALIVALTKPDMPRTTDETSNYNYYGKNDSVLGPDYIFRGFEYEKKKKATDISKGGWRCRYCGQLNAGYVGTCSCGHEKPWQMSEKSSEQIQQNSWNIQPQMFYCTSCGKQMEADSKFCRYCGAKAE